MSGERRDASKNGETKDRRFCGGKMTVAGRFRGDFQPDFSPKMTFRRRNTTCQKTSMLLLNKISPGRNHFSCPCLNGCFRLPSPRRKKVGEMVRQRPGLAT
jgi:hypothetical protein